MKVYIVFFYCCRLDPQSIYGVYSTKKLANKVSKKVSGSWIETFKVVQEEKDGIE